MIERLVTFIGALGFVAFGGCPCWYGAYDLCDPQDSRVHHRKPSLDRKPQ